MRGPAPSVAAALAAVATTLALAPAAHADDRAALRQRSAETALPLLRLVTDDGGLADPEGRSVGYGGAMLGAAGLRAARDGHPEALEPSLRLLRRAARDTGASGDALRELTVAGRRVPVEDGRWDPFALWALVDAYRTGEATLDGDPRWEPVATDLREAFAKRPLVRPTRYTNRTLVEAAAVSALPAEAAPGAPRGAALANPTGTRTRIARMLRILPSRSGPQARTDGWLGGGRVLSDGPKNPLAYSALSLVALDDLAGIRGRRADAVALRAGRFVLAAAAPDGELAWAGRSDRQSWTLAASALAGRQLARGEDERARRGGRLLAGRALQRLGSAYRPRADGLPAIVPALSGAAPGTTATLIPPGLGDGVDRYASTATYGGLTAWLLSRAADVPDAPPARDEKTGAGPAGSSGFLVDRGGAHVATLRRKDWWVGVVIDTAGTDLRGLPGLASVKRRVGGRWVDVLAARPRVSGAPDLPRRIDHTPFRVWRVDARRDAIVLTGAWGAIRGRIELGLDDRGVVVRIRGLRNVEIAAWSDRFPELLPSESPEGGGGSRPLPLPGGRYVLPPRSLRLPAKGPIPSATAATVWESLLLPAVGADGVVARITG